MNFNRFQKECQENHFKSLNCFVFKHFFLILTVFLKRPNYKYNAVLTSDGQVDEAHVSSEESSNIELLLPVVPVVAKSVRIQTNILNDVGQIIFKNLNLQGCSSFSCFYFLH